MVSSFLVHIYKTIILLKHDENVDSKHFMSYYYLFMNNFQYRLISYLIFELFRELLSYWRTYRISVVNFSFWFLASLYFQVKSIRLRFWNLLKWALELAHGHCFAYVLNVLENMHIAIGGIKVLYMLISSSLQERNYCNNPWKGDAGLNQHITGGGRGEWLDSSRVFCFKSKGPKLNFSCLPLLSLLITPLIIFPLSENEDSILFIVSFKYLNHPWLLSFSITLYHTHTGASHLSMLKASPSAHCPPTSWV